jgi:serine/threonine protein kinase
MSPEQWKRAQQLFEQVAGLPARERAEFLEAACGDDAELCAEVDSLLSHHDQASSQFMADYARSQRTDVADLLTHSQVDLAIGAASARLTRLEGYDGLREIGHGGMGRVYQARDMRLNRIVAIKTIATDARSDVHFDLFDREAQLTANLRHPNIVTIFSYEPRKPAPHFVMEWVDGQPLDQYCRRRRLSNDDGARLLEKIARAVAYAHDRGVIHRDLKPQNIFVDSMGEPRILDFGLARIAAKVADTSSVGGAVKGTPRYMAPEQVLSPEEVDRAADIFALGLILYELATGAPPPNAPDVENHDAWKNRLLPLPREQNPDVPEALQRICLKATEVDPRNRYTTADHFADDLRRFIEGTPITTRPTRYAKLLESRVREHMDVLSSWKQENLITHRELDALHDRYLGLLRADSLWVPEARKLRTGPLLTQLGGWLLVLSAVLWPIFYWDEDLRLSYGGLQVSFTGTMRVLLEAIPTIIVNIWAFRLWSRGSKLTALIFTVTGILLVPVFLSILQGVIGFPSWNRGSKYEVEPSRSTNLQMFLATSAGLAYGVYWLRQRRYTLLFGAVAVVAAVFWATLLFVAGMKDWLGRQEFASTATCWLPFVGAMYLAGYRLDRRESDHLAIPFYAFAAGSFLVVTAILALDAPDSWLGLKKAAYVSSTQPVDVVEPLRTARAICFFICGLLYLGIALVLDRSKTRLRRLWGGIMFRLVPPVCLLSWDALGEEPLGGFWFYKDIQGNEIFYLTPIEISVPILCFVLAGVAMRFQLRWFMYYSLIHLAWFIFRTTDRFLKNELAWPFTLVGVGILALVAGLWIERLREKYYPSDTPSLALESAD